MTDAQLATFSCAYSTAEHMLHRPLLEGEFPISEIRKAQEVFLAKKHIGNLVIILQ